MKLTIYHDGQFWVGVIEQVTDQGLMAARYIFGEEPQDETVLAFINHELIQVLQSQTVAVAYEARPAARVNPKRMARLAARETHAVGISTKAQDALRAQLEQNKQERKVKSREEKLAEEERRWLLARAKAKKKHTGK